MEQLINKMLLTFLNSKDDLLDRENFIIYTYEKFNKNVYLELKEYKNLPENFTSDIFDFLDKLQSKGFIEKYEIVPSYTFEICDTL